MNGLGRDVGHGTAVDFLHRLQEGSRFDVTREPGSVWSNGIAYFERHDRLSLADGLLVATARHHDLPHCYSFDDDFDGFDGITRLPTPENPFTPE